MSFKLTTPVGLQMLLILKSQQLEVRNIACMHHYVTVVYTSLKCIWIMLMHASALAGDEAYPSFIGAAPVNLSDMDYGFPTHQSFSAREVSDGTFFKSISDYDPDSQRLLYQLEE